MAGPRRQSSKGATVTIKDVASAAGVSTAAVAYSLNGNSGVSEATRSRVLKIAAELGYVGNPHARSLRTGQSGILGLVIRDMRNPYFLDVIAGAQAYANNAKKTLLAVDSDCDPELELRHVRRLAALNADGLAIAPTGARESLDLWSELQPGRPLVVLNASSETTRAYQNVSADRVAALTSALGHLIDLGHRRVAFLELASTILGDTDRREIFQSLTHDLAIEPRIVEVSMRTDDVRAEMTAVLAAPDRPTAIIANSDHFAHAVYDAARSLGLRIGVDLSVVGQDDLVTSHLLDPPLTTVRVDARNIGQAMAQRLVSDRPLPEHREPVELVVRASTGPAPH